MNNKICTVSTVKAPKEQLIQWVNYHLNIGIDHMFIFFDDPNDPAIEKLKNYEKVTCFRCDEKHWEKLTSRKDLGKLIIKMKNNRPNLSNLLARKGSKRDLARVEKQKLNSIIALESARKNNFDWIAHIDSDELIYLKKPLKKFLEKLPKKLDFVKLPSLEAVPEKYSYKDIFKEITLFKNNFGKISQSYFRGHIAGKSITRTHEKIEHLGIHKPKAKKEFNLKFKHPLFNARLLHYDAPSFESWKNKWLERYNGQVIAIAMKKSRVELYEEFIKAYKKGDNEEIKKIYKKHYIIPEPIKTVFILLGILLRINLDEELFDESQKNI